MEHFVNNAYILPVYCKKKAKSSCKKRILQLKKIYILCRKTEQKTTSKKRLEKAKKNIKKKKKKKAGRISEDNSSDRRQEWQFFVWLTVVDTVWYTYDFCEVHKKNQMWANWHCLSRIWYDLFLNESRTYI